MRRYYSTIQRFRVGKIFYVLKDAHHGCISAFQMLTMLTMAAFI